MSDINLGYQSYFGDTPSTTPMTAMDQAKFQEYMSNTAHQREVADLKAAGINPAVSANTNGASTPNGANDNVMESLLTGAALSGGSLAGVKDDSWLFNFLTGVLGWNKTRANGFTGMVNDVVDVFTGGNTGSGNGSLNGSPSATDGEKNLAMTIVSQVKQGAEDLWNRLTDDKGISKLWYNGGTSSGLIAYGDDDENNLIWNPNSGDPYPWSDYNDADWINSGSFQQSYGLLNDPDSHVGEHVLGGLRESLAREIEGYAKMSQHEDALQNGTGLLGKLYNWLTNEDNWTIDSAPVAQNDGNSGQTVSKKTSPSITLKNQSLRDQYLM